MLPEGWAECGLHAVSSAPISYGVVKPGDHDPKGVAFIRGGDFPNGKLDPTTLRTITRTVSDQYRRTRLKGGEILISLVGYPGACVVVPPELAGANIARQAAVIRPRTGVSTGFLFQFIRSPIGQSLLLEKTIGSAQQVINLKDLREVIIPLPPLAEQRKITEILSTWDRAIETVEKLIANARAQKKALMQQLLTGRKRLPGFEGDWRSVSLGELGNFRKGKGIQRDQVRDTGLPCVRYGEIYTHHHYQVRNFNSFIDAQTAAESEPLSSGDLLFTCSGETAEEIGKCVAYLAADEAYAGSDIIILSPSSDNAGFLSYVLNDTAVVEQKQRFGQGNSIVHISAANLSKLTFKMPSGPEQAAIARIIDVEVDHIDKLASELAALRQERSALMQQLLTGRRRVQMIEVAT